LLVTNASKIKVSFGHGENPILNFFIVLLLNCFIANASQNNLSI
jgi:hypothetical protein